MNHKDSRDKSMHTEKSLYRYIKNQMLIVTTVNIVPVLL